MIKKYNRRLFREKFRSYRVCFCVFAFLFLAAWIAQPFIYGNFGITFEGMEGSFLTVFSDLFAFELLILLSLFLLGVTVYAPLFGALCSVFRGLFSGFCLSVLGLDLHTAEKIFLFALVFLYLLASAWLIIAYASFCSVCAIRIHSDPQIGKRGERQMFGGTLFYSGFFKGSINLRFLGSYVLLFFCSCFFVFLLTAAFAALRILI